DLWCREMRSSDDNRTRACDILLIDVGLGKRHVGAVLPVENKRKVLAIADAENDQGGEPRGIDLQMRDIDAFSRHLLADEPAHCLIADARQKPGGKTQPCRADRDVRRAAADILREARHVLEATANLLAVKVD